MREILFRGKQKSNGNWVHGDLSYHRDGRVFIRCWDRLEFDPTYNAYEVNPETVGQFTGLTDKNGKTIFEGDIITFGSGLAWPVAFDMNAFVAMDGHRVQFALFEQYSWDHKTGEPIAPDYIEVIGNIHDNPELLEVRE